jgi:protein TonB
MAPPPTPAPPLQKPAPPVPRQLALTAPRPAPAPLPVHTAAAAPEQAEVRTPGKPEALPPVVAAAAAVDAPVARAAVPGPRTISTEGIPSDYVNQVFDRINRRVVYPRGARLRGEQGRVAYRLTLSPQGELLKLDIQPCGSDELDQAASKAIKAAAPFPKLPDLGGTSYLLAGSIQFSLNAL